MKYELLIFDADGTLFDFDKTEEFALSKTFEKYNLPKYNSDILKTYKGVNKQIWQEFERGEINAKELKPERFRRFLKEIRIDNLNPAEVSDYFLTSLSMNSNLLEGANSLISELSTKYKLVLMTNGLTKVQKPRFKNSQIYNYFDLIIISEEIGLSKPNREIFEFAFEKLNYFDKSKTLMVGDNLSSDIQGGMNFGIDSVWYNPTKNENNSEIKPTYEISRLYQLKTILANQSFAK